MGTESEGVKHGEINCIIYSFSITISKNYLSKTEMLSIKLKIH